MTHDFAYKHKSTTFVCALNHYVVDGFQNFSNSDTSVLIFCLHLSDKLYTSQAAFQMFLHGHWRLSVWVLRFENRHFEIMERVSERILELLSNFINGQTNSSTQL